MAETILSVVKGTRREFTLSILDTDGNPVTSFTSAATPSASIWSGGSTSSLATPLVEWIDPTAGTLRLTLFSTDLSALDVQPYPIRVTLLHSGYTLEVWRGWIDVQPEPGASTVLPTYCDFRHLVDYGGEWVKRLVVTSSYSGFQRERARARSTLDDWILARWRPDYALSVFDLTVYGSLGALEGPDKTIRDYLDANNLIVTDKVREITARLALSYVCETANEDDMRARGVAHYRRASAIAKTYVAQLDTNADGAADISIPLGIINTRVN